MRSLHSLDQAEWERLDQHLDALIDLDDGDCAARLEQLADTDPESAALLHGLLASMRSEQRLEHSLRSALGFLAGQESASAGTLIGPWRLLRRIGHGGMAEVFLAERADGAFERQVALKLLWPGLVNERADQLVRRERQMLARLVDPRIAGLLDGGVTDAGQPWLVMEYVEGQSITHACQDRGYALAQRLAVAIEVAEAVATAHRQLVAHGDIKPANVLLTAGGQVKLLDFGIGRLLNEPGADVDAAPRWRALTPDYASPEQRNGGPPTPATDIYQLGLLLRGLIAPVLPAGGRRRRELDAVLARALDPEPQHRYPSAEALVADLRAVLAQRPVQVLSARPWYRLQCLLRRRWTSLSVAAAICLFGALLLQQQFAQSQLLAQRNATNEAVLGFLNDLLDRSNPRASDDKQHLLSGQVLIDAAARLDAQLAAQPAAKVEILNTLGRIHRARHELVQARARYQEALNLARAKGLHDAIDSALDGLANVGIWSGDYAQSEALLNTLIQTRLQAGREPATVDAARLQLADLQHSRGNYDAALRNVAQVDINGPHPAWRWRVVSMIERDRGNFSVADHALQQSMAITDKAAQADPVLKLELLDYLAMLRLYQGQLDGAKQVIDTSEQMRERLLGKAWVGLRWTRHWAALHALAVGSLEQAASLLDITLADYERSFGAESHLLAYARSDRGFVALAQGDAVAAERWFKLAAERLQSMDQGDHPRAAEALLGGALAALAQGHNSVAKQHAAQALAIRKQLPDNATGAIQWRANACEVLRLAGGQCTVAPQPDNMAIGLDTHKLRQALRGLCRQPIAASALPCAAAVQAPGTTARFDSAD